MPHSRKVFNAKSPGEAIRAALGGDSIVDSQAVTVTAPEVAESGDVVPVSVATDLTEIGSITLVADDNPVPIVATYRLAPEVEGFIATINHPMSIGAGGPRLRQVP